MFTNRGKALTFDDILLVPAFSEITPDAVDLSTWLTPSIPLRIPLLSAAMDTVTESAMAISMARMGGIGIIHKNMPIDRQRLEVERVKKSESGMILDPVTIPSTSSVQEALDLMADFRVSGLPVVDDYLDGPAFQDGLVYFGYFREGTGVSDSLERYCIDARPDREHLLQQIG